MRNAWTGGQYSLVRALTGIGLLVFFASRVPAVLDQFQPRHGLLVGAGALASVCLAIGWRDRLAALAVWFVLSSWLGSVRWFSFDSAILAIGMLIVMACVPPAPFGSLESRGRVDPRGDWSMPPGTFAGGWAIMALTYTNSSYALFFPWSNSLAEPAMWPLLAFEFFYVPLAFIRRARPWIWTVMFVVHVVRLGLLVSASYFAAASSFVFLLLLFHLFTFDPAWMPGRAAGTVDKMLYDGSCGLCHRSVRLVLAEDTGKAFVFAPLGEEDFGVDSIVVQTADGRVLTRSDAVVHLLQRLGGLWRVIGIVLGLVPRVVRNAGYDLVARVRYRIFGRTKDACPLMPADLRSRFV